MLSHNNLVIYVGVTNDLIRRVYEHKHHLAEGFTHKYKVEKLVYFEQFNDIRDAIAREKQIKAGSRQKKFNLITKNNSDFSDLYCTIV